MIGGCTEQTPVSAKYDFDSCRRISIYDQATGARINGAEDIAIDRIRERLFVSAYDRRAVEKAARKNAFAIPEGGVYAIPIKTLLDTESDILTLPPIAAADEIPGGFRPHGVSFDAHANEVVFINRSYQRIKNRWTMTPRIERIGAAGEAFMGRSEVAPCSANDVHAGVDGTLASFDHGACDWRAGLEDTFSLSRSGVLKDGNVLFNDAKFANGLTRTLDGELILAATREKALLVMEEIANGLKPVRRIELPGGPDNLTIASDGGVVAAVHPSLVKMGMHRKLGFGRASSRIVKVSLESDTVEILYDDPGGALFTAATAAVEWGNALIAGSVTDDGLLICEKS